MADNPPNPSGPIPPLPSSGRTGRLPSPTTQLPARKAGIGKIVVMLSSVAKSAPAPTATQGLPGAVPATGVPPKIALGETAKAVHRPPPLPTWFKRSRPASSLRKPAPNIFRRSSSEDAPPKPILPQNRFSWNLLREGKLNRPSNRRRCRSPSRRKVSFHIHTHFMLRPPLLGKAPEPSMEKLRPPHLPTDPRKVETAGDAASNPPQLPGVIKAPPLIESESATDKLASGVAGENHSSAGRFRRQGSRNGKLDEQVDSAGGFFLFEQPGPARGRTQNCRGQTGVEARGSFPALARHRQAVRRGSAAGRSGRKRENDRHDRLVEFADGDSHDRSSRPMARAGSGDFRSPGNTIPHARRRSGFLQGSVAPDARGPRQEAACPGNRRILPHVCRRHGVALFRRSLFLPGHSGGRPDHSAAGHDAQQRGMDRH